MKDGSGKRDGVAAIEGKFGKSFRWDSGEARARARMNELFRDKDGIIETG